jgi:hypothetical protein
LLFRGELGRAWCRRFLKNLPFRALDENIFSLTESADSHRIVAILPRFFNALLTRKPDKFESPIKVKLEVVQKKRQGKWRALGDDFRTLWLKDCAPERPQAVI